MTIDRLRIGLLLGTGVLALLLPACTWDGNFTFLGYSTAPNYNTAYHTVHVPIFKNLTLYQGLEFELTRAIIREIEAKTPYKVVANRDTADTELTGTITFFAKNMLNYNQLNEVREAQTTLTCEVIWKDLHTGEPLSQPRPRNIDVYPNLPAAPPVGQLPLPQPLVGLPGQNIPVPVSPFAQPGTAPLQTPPEPQDQGGLAVPVPPAPLNPLPVVIQSTATFIPELGGSLTTAQFANVNKMAIQIVNMMEKPW